MSENDTHPTKDAPFQAMGTVGKLPPIRKKWVDWCIQECKGLDDGEYLYLKLDDIKRISGITALMRRYDIITRRRTIGGVNYLFMQEDRGRTTPRMSAVVKANDAKKRGLQELPASNLVEVHSDPDREDFYTGA